MDVKIQICKKREKEKKRVLQILTFRVKGLYRMSSI